LALIEHYGGHCHLVDGGGAGYAEAERLGAQDGWFYLDQFSNAATATDWRGNNNIACSIFEQMAMERFPIPEWIVVGAGTGGTSATIGRYCRYTGQPTRVAVGDPQGSVFYEAWQSGRRDITGVGSIIEGIGRPRVEPSFVPAVIDEVLPIADAESIAAMRLLADVMGIRAGASTGTNLSAALRLVDRMRRAGTTGSIVTIICDGGDRYLDTYYSDEWVAARGIDLAAPRARFEQFLATGQLQPTGELEAPTVEGMSALTPTASADATPLLPTDGLDNLRPDVRDFTRSVDILVISPDDASALSHVDRARIALIVATVNNNSALVRRFTDRLSDLDDADGAALVADPDRWSAFGPTTAALLAHSEQMALDPEDAGEDEIAELTALGISAATIVAASQVVAYVSYLSRLLQGMDAIDEESNLSAPSALPAFTATLDAEATTFPAYAWQPSVQPAEVPAAMGDAAKAPAKWSPFYLTLLHDPLVLEERTALYNAIMTGTGSLDRADRELAALATSLVTGCEYCASVHGRRQMQLSKDSVTAVALAQRGPLTLTDPRQQAIVAVAAAAAVTPPNINAADVATLRAVGLDDDAVRDMIAVAAMFAWANRLMMTLGEATL
jgi:uncharacterized peroxidase-related enzyme